MTKSKENFPFISIIIPTFREEKVLDRCLKSLLNQDYPSDKFEIILISKNKIEVEENKKIKIIYNANFIHSRNEGAKIAKGQILAFIDDDCLAPKDWLSKAINYFEDERVGLVGGPALPPKEEPDLLCRIGGYLMSSFFVTGFASSRYKLLSCSFEASEDYLILANNFIRRKAFESVSGFDTKIPAAEENDLYFRLKKRGHKLLYAPEIFVWHDVRPIFFPFIKRIFFYASGRGFLMARKSETIRFFYLIPSFCVLSLLGIFILLFLSKEIYYFLIGIIFFYLLWNIINDFYIFLKFERNPLILLYVPIATFLVHFSYGFGIFYGFYKFILAARIPRPSDNRG